ncbi:MAG: 5-oxoprolinase subunit PxpB [Gemmatimonadaceae bacterium]
MSSVGSALRARPLGDSAITITFGTERSAALLTRIQEVARALQKETLPHVDDIVPAYLSLAVFYNSLEIAYGDIAETLVDACERAARAARGITQTHSHVIPVRYDGIDLDAVAAATGLSRDEIVSRHTARTYTVDLLGFVPGFAYLSEIDPALQLPRRAQPRPRVAAGSVAIAAAQTAVYPLDTPGGWHIIGNTTTVMFDPARTPPALLAPGDAVRFEQVA